MTKGQTSILHVTPTQCAIGALRDLGKYNITFGHLFHRIQGVLVSELNGRLVNTFMCIKNKELAMTYKALE